MGTTKMSAAENWKLYLPPRGTLFSKKLCGACGTRWHTSEIPGGAPTGHDVYELFIHRGPCKQCPAKEGNDANSVDTRRTRDNRLAMEPHQRLVDAVASRRTVASRKGDRPMAMIAKWFAR